MLFDREEYLDDDDVRAFVVHLASLLDGTTELDFTVGFSRFKLPPSFEDKFNGRVEGRGAGAVYVVSTETLEELFQRYWWDRRHYCENKRELDHVTDAIRSAISSELHENALEIAHAACRRLMRWAFREGSRPYVKNMEWATGLGPKLLDVLSNGRNALQSDCPDLSVFSRTGDDGIPWSKMNAGWTKYYALALPKHLIYDGRVGGGLGYLVRQFLERQPAHQRPRMVPEKLRFRWAPGEGAGNLRDPSSRTYKFGRLAGGPYGSREWARVNLMANWVVAAARDASGAAWCAGDDGLRRIEAALFMLGYDLSRTDSAC